MPHDAWNPGLTSDIPARLLPSVTLYRPENSRVDYEAAREAAQFCGLKAQDMVCFTTERLVKHELLIRVTADLSVPDGPNYEELGINLRGMVARIYDGFALSEMDALRDALAALRSEAKGVMEAALADAFAPQDVSKPKASFLGGLLGRKPDVKPPARSDMDVLSSLETMRASQAKPERKAAYDALIIVVGGIIGAQGRLGTDLDLITGLALNMFMNNRGTVEIGRLIGPIMQRAAKAEGYRFLPAQDKPFFMNVKGASASGKSTIRPQQRALADKLGIPWEDFALISPDYWRKYLADYDALGEDYKYAAMLTGQELEIIDKKLDAYVESKARSVGIPHLLIDRFRFDSFSTDKEGNISSKLLTRFGDTVFLFFLVTPPAATVERAYARGLETGRFKAVDDLLYHNIEAYTGMPQLFLSWIGASDKKIHFEFLDNSVALGERPRTIAYGWNDRMVVLDVEGLHNIDRYAAVNVGAERAEDVLETAPELTFLDRCVARFGEVSVVDRNSGRVVRAAKGGVWRDKPDVSFDADMRNADKALTLGAW